MARAAMVDWAEALQGYPTAAIRSALDQCDKAHPDYPPSRAAFAGLVWSADKRLREIDEAQADKPKKLAPPRHTARSKRYFAKWRKMLK